MSRERIDQLLDEPAVDYDRAYEDCGLSALPADLLGIKWRHVLCAVLSLPWIALREWRARAR